MNPNCSTGCADVLLALPEVLFDDCSPEVNAGEVETIYLGLRGQGFTNWTSPAEWASRLAATDNTKIIALTVIGDKPKPTANTKDISGGRKISLPKAHTLPFIIDETNATNHEFVRQLECGGNFQAWYATSGGLAFGGNDGIKAFAEADMVIPRARGENMVYDGSLSWEAKYTEERIVSPIV